ncbi:MAG: hypothetical protein COA84_07565 [Robiginitomaculum sp.]|nr:MAG: hypothetical protein COA84_07565 [Robiginitomaculum sp.]
MAARIDVANSALAHLGNLPIGDMDFDDPKGKAEILVAAFMDRALEYVLKLQGWSDAKTRASLAAQTPAPEYGYSLSYPVPSDLVYLAYVDADVYEYEGRHILTNVGAPLKIQFNRLIGVAEAGPLLAELVALRLAMIIAMPLKASVSAKKELTLLFKKELRTAVLVDNFEAARGAVLGSNLNLARHGVPVEDAADTPHWRG